MDALPNEIVAHIFASAPDADALAAAARLVCWRWHAIVALSWEPVDAHAYGRCYQFLRDVEPSLLEHCRTKQEVVRRALALSAIWGDEAGPHLTETRLVPYDYATCMRHDMGDDTFAAAAAADRCPKCDCLPGACVCACDCWRCRGKTRRIANCKHPCSDVWDSDYPHDWYDGTDNAALLASEYNDLGEAVERHRVSTRGTRSRRRWPPLCHWDAVVGSRDAVVYVARCCQTLVCHALCEDEADFARMSCTAVIRRAHRLVDYKACLGRVWEIRGCKCRSWTFGDKRCSCDNVKYYYDSNKVETDSMFHLDVDDDDGKPHGLLRRG